MWHKSMCGLSSIDTYLPPPLSLSLAVGLWRCVPRTNQGMSHSGCGGAAKRRRRINQSKSMNKVDAGRDQEEEGGGGGRGGRGGRGGGQENANFARRSRRKARRHLATGVPPPTLQGFPRLKANAALTQFVHVFHEYTELNQAP